MTIDIYSKYKVKFISKGAYISQEDSTPNDITFSHYEDNNEQVISGYDLLKFIGNKLINKDIDEFSVSDNNINIQTFNCLNGEGNEYNLVIERIENEIGD